MENAPELSWDDDDYGDNDDDNDDACDVGLKVDGNNIYTHMNKYICTTHPPTQQASHPPTHPASQPACQPDSPQPTHPPTKPQCSVHYIRSLPPMTCCGGPNSGGVTDESTGTLFTPSTVPTSTSHTKSASENILLMLLLVRYALQFFVTQIRREYPIYKCHPSKCYLTYIQVETRESKLFFSIMLSPIFATDTREYC